MKKCPFCGANIEDSARFCLYCMQSLTEKKQIPPYKKKRPQWVLIIAVIVAIYVILLIVSLGKQFPFGSKTPTNNLQPETTSTPIDTEPSSPLHNHNFSVENTAVEYQKDAATCITPAIFYYSCACGEKSNEVFTYGKTASHTIVTEAGYPATCKTQGLTDGTYCSICSTELSAQTQTPIVNHTYDNDQDENCNVCNYVRVLNCSHTKTVKLAAIAANCTTSGLTEGKKCSLCEEILISQTVLAPLGHNAVIDPAIEATCTKDGKTQGKHCSTCNVVLVAQVTLKANGHTEVTDPPVAANCTTGGKTEGKHCATCNVVLAPQQPTPALGHNFGPGNNLSNCTVCGAQPSHTHSYTVKNTATEYQKDAANCISPAVYCYSCSCGEKGSETFSSGEKGECNVVEDKGYPATCNTPGLSNGTHCSVCLHVYMPQKETQALGHTFKPGDSLPTCLSCADKGTVIVQAPDSLFFKNNTFRINSITYVIRPDTINEKWEITVNLNCTNLTSASALMSPECSLHFYDANGYKTGVLGSNYSRYLQPNESGTCTVLFRVAKSTDAYKLVIY